MSLRELLELRTHNIEEVISSIRAMKEEIEDGEPFNLPLPQSNDSSGLDIDEESAEGQHLKAALLEVVESLRAFRQVLEASERVLEEIVLVVSGSDSLDVPYPDFRSQLSMRTIMRFSVGLLITNSIIPVLLSLCLGDMIKS